MPDSLFGSDDDNSLDEGIAATGCSSAPNASHVDDILIASSTCPPIRGLYVLRAAVPQNVLDDLAETLSAEVWPGSTDQVMLFTSPERPSLPTFLGPWLDLLPHLLEPLPDDVKQSVLRSPQPMQAIFNCYHPGQGISPHVDLPDRYGDAVVGLSLLSSTVMEFRRLPLAHSSAQTRTGGRGDRFPDAYAVRLRPGDVYVLSGDARWNWTHGIPYREEDLVEDEKGRPMRVRRGLRFSVTLRRMKEGAQVVGLAETPETGNADG
ncbi:hypothetical protein JCM10908_002870 [Rhodotorula pacifica]|uniref:uncharacterized protein n=1 Tax=Rhodotorula pacifica TaxID=1495444 RepID=UPI00316E09AD